MTVPGQAENFTNAGMHATWTVKGRRTAHSMDSRSGFKAVSAPNGLPAAAAARRRCPAAAAEPAAG